MRGNFKPHTAEAKAKLSAANKGQKRSAETRAKMSAAKKGAPLSETHKAAISAAKRGKPWSEAAKARVRESNRLLRSCLWTPNAIGWTSGCGQTHVNVGITRELPFQFCPWCGKALEEEK